MSGDGGLKPARAGTAGEVRAVPGDADPEGEDRFGRLRPWCVGAGVVVVVAGVLLHLPELRMLGEGDGMPMDMRWTPVMVTGMVAVTAGVLLTMIGLFAGRPRPRASVPVVGHIEHGRTRPVYWVTCGVLIVALVIDTMKPLTIAFVLPGMADEYGMSTSAVSILPVVALTGTTAGSVVWGVIGDRYGRRPALVLATVLFIATSVCGAMPSFAWNLVMCFTMGMSAGGMLPLVFTLLAEVAHRRHRGWMAVAIGAVGGLAGYLAASVAASQLEPRYTWRALWLIGLPTGLLLLAVLPLIPESPLFLLRQGRRAAAERILGRFGARLTVRPYSPDLASPGLRELLRSRTAVTLAIGLVGLSWGLVNFGFLGLLPAQLSEAGISSTSASALVARAALYSAPALLVVVVLYAIWSSRGSLILFVTITAVALTGVVAWSIDDGGDALLTGSVGLLVLTLAAVNAVLVPYSTEIYPTEFRARGASLAAASTKLGGVLGPVVMLGFLQVSTPGRPTLAVSAIVFGGLSLLAAALMLRYGRTPPSLPTR